MKSGLKVIKWILRITAILLLIAAVWYGPKVIKNLEPTPPSLKAVTVCPTSDECEDWEFTQGQDNVFLHIETQGDWDKEDIVISGIYMLGDIEYEIFKMTEEIVGDEVLVLEKNLKTGWLIGEYYVEVSIVDDNSNVIHTTFDIIAGS